MRAVRRPVRSTDTMPLQQFATSGEVLDANSTATVLVTGPQLFVSAYPPDWSFRPLRVFSISSTKRGIEVHAEQQLAAESSTVNREVLLEGFAQADQNPTSGIFIAGRPVRKRLFELQFKFPQGGLPKRKPFVWIPEGATEE